MKVLCLSVERGTLLGVPFVPVVHKGCWVGEAEVSDPRVLAELARHPQFVLTGETSALTPPTFIAEPAPVLNEPGVKPVAELVTVPSGNQAGVVTVGPLPENLPGRSYLVRAGIETVEDVHAMSDEQIIAVEGIGPKTLKDIRKALKG